MRPTQLFVFFALVYLVECRNNVKSLTENMGHEIIEIGAPIKGVEEEPSGENEEEVSKAAASTKRDPKRVVTTTQKKEVEKEDTVSQEDEEARIEKELAEIYKDTDYKAESSESKKDAKLTNATNLELDKPIGRSKNAFKFQPDLNNRADIERFRTSVDDISCDRRVTERLSAEVTKSNATSNILNFAQIALVILSLVVCY